MQYFILNGYLKQLWIKISRLNFKQFTKWLVWGWTCLSFVWVVLSTVQTLFLSWWHEKDMRERERKRERERETWKLFHLTIDTTLLCADMVIFRKRKSLVHRPSKTCSKVGVQSRKNIKINISMNQLWETGMQQNILFLKCSWPKSFLDTFDE